MKSEIIQKQESEITYPILMQNRHIGCVVLFYSEASGMAVNKGSSPYKLGFHSNCWFPANDKTHWKLFEGTIELSN